MKTINFTKFVKKLSLFGMIVLTISILGSCNSKNASRELKIAIRSAAKDDVVTAAEFAELEELVASEEELGYTTAELEAFIMETARKEITIELPVAPEDEPKNEYNVYVENSGSMYGYMEGNTNFKKSLYDLLTRFNGNEEKFTLNIINDLILNYDEISQTLKREPDTLVTGQLRSFMDYLQPSTLKKKGMGNYQSSKINQIFQDIVVKMEKDGKPAVLISDYIYSIDGKSDMQGELADQKFTTKATFQNIKKDHAVLIIKISSEFNGKYYAYNNSVLRMDEDRPVYIWVIGKKQLVFDFVEEYNIKTLDGYEEHLLLYSSEKPLQPFYTVLKQTGKLGRFKAKDRRSETVKAIEGISVDRNDGGFAFSVAVDLSQLDVSKDYLLDMDNWELSTDKFSFEIETIDEIGNAATNDKKDFGTATHFLTVITDEKITEKDELKLALIKRLPKWVAESSVEDDTSPEKLKGKTFGFSYLVEGVAEAFDKKQEQVIYLSIAVDLDE